MAGYWDRAIKTVFPTASEIREDWDRKTVQFELTSFGKGATFAICELKEIERTLGCTALVI